MDGKLLGYGMNEPSVLDYVKSKIFFWRGEVVEIPPVGEEPGADPFLVSVESMPLGSGGGSVSRAETKSFNFSQLRELNIAQWKGWWAITPITLSLVAQLAFEPPDRFVLTGLVIYLIVTGMLLLGNLRGKISLPDNPAGELVADSLNVRSIFMWISLGLGLLAFITFGENRFTQVNLLLWIMSIGLFFAVFWRPTGFLNKMRVAKERFASEGLHLSPWAILVIIIFALASFFRFYHLDQVPSEMFSDHAEKLIDVSDVLSGQYSIFFPRNTPKLILVLPISIVNNIKFN